MIVLRFLFFGFSLVLAWWCGKADAFASAPAWLSPALAAGIPVAAVVVIAIDLLIPRKDLLSAAVIYAGVTAGLILSALVASIVRELPLAGDVRVALDAVLALMLVYACVSLLWQSRAELRWWLPGGRGSAMSASGSRPWLLDTSAVIDGRIADVVETGAVGGPLIVPAFVVAELQRIADQSDRARRARGRRGLDILNRLRNSPQAQLQVDERELPEFEGQPVDTRLVLLARELGAKVVTHDYNLNKVAQVHGIEVVNLNDLAKALRPVFLPGEQLEAHLIKPGEEPGQGVGYLDDGTMIVVDGGRERLNQTVKITVTSVLQTSAGRMIFGRCDK